MPCAVDSSRFRSFLCSQHEPLCEQKVVKRSKLTHVCFNKQVQRHFRGRTDSPFSSFSVRRATPTRDSRVFSSRKKNTAGKALLRGFVVIRINHAPQKPQFLPCLHTRFLQSSSSHRVHRKAFLSLELPRPPETATVIISRSSATNRSPVTRT